MKKLLIASAALAMVAGTAQAQSSVTVYGLLDIGVSETKNKSTTTAGATTTSTITNSGNGDGALATSRLGFRGTEDLGAGRKANFQLEYDLVDAGTGGNSFGARYSWVGLEDAKLGQLRLGQQETTMHSVFTAGLAGGANNMAGSVYSAGDTTNSISNNDASIRPYSVFVNRAVTYISPSISGVRFEVQSANYNSTSDAAGSRVADTRNALNAASLKYSFGKLNLAAAIQQQKTDTSATSNDTTKRETEAYTANYDFGVVRAFGVYTTDKVTNFGGVTRDTKTTEIGLQLPVGKTTLWASAFDGDRKGTGTSADVAGLASRNADVKGYQVGVRNDLSKRTALYAIVGQQEIAGKDGNAAKIKSEGMAVGVRHSF